jgi:hypothetical protein
MALLLVDQTISDVLPISSTKQTISQSNEKDLEHYLGTVFSTLQFWLKL